MKIEAEGGLTDKIMISLYHAAFLLLCEQFAKWYPYDGCSEYVRRILLMPRFRDAAQLLPQMVIAKYAPFLTEPRVALLPDIGGFLVLFGAAAVFMPSPLADPVLSTKVWDDIVSSNSPTSVRSWVLDGTSQEDDDPGLVVTSDGTGESRRLW